MSRTGLKTYIKNVDCCLEDNYNMTFVLENPSDIKEITWTLGFDLPWNAGGWINRPDTEGQINVDDVICERLSETVSDYIVVWNNGIITLKSKEGKSIPSGSGDVLSFLFGDSSHLPISEGESVIKIIDVVYTDTNDVIHRINEESNSKINIRKKAIVYDDNHNTSKEDNTATDNTEITVTNNSPESNTNQQETNTNQQETNVKDEILIAIIKDKASTSFDITEKTISENVINVTILNTSQNSSGEGELSLTLKNISHSDYSFSINGGNMVSNQKYFIPSNKW